MFYLQAPFLFSLELTSACNNCCPGCGNIFGHQPASLSAEAWVKILNVLRPHARALKITGGEPTLHSEFEMIIKSIDTMGVPFTLFTNARWIHPDQTIKILSQAKNMGGLLISLHGADSTTHEAFSSMSGSFTQTCHNICSAVQAGLRVHISTVLNAYNIYQLEQIVEFSRSLGAKRVVFNRFLGKSDSPYQPTVRDLKRAIHQIECLRQRYPVRRDNEFSICYGNCIPQCFYESGSSGCWAGVAYCTIDPWGNLRPCNHSSTIVGSLFDQPLEALWKSEIMENWRALMPQACLACGTYEQCHGGCRALMELDGRDVDPLMRSPLVTDEPICVMEFYQQAKPILVCDVLPAQPGWALTRGLSIFPVSKEALLILEVLDGRTALEDLQVIHGQDGLNFIGELIRRGFVRLV